MALVPSRLSAVAWPGHIYLFGQNQSGELLVAGKRTTPEDLSSAATKIDNPVWELGNADTTALPGSAITFIEGSNKFRAYFQRPNRSLGELCADATGGSKEDWSIGGFTTGATLPGTDLAVVQFGPRWHRLHVFYQGSDYSIYRTSHIGGWSPPQRLSFRALAYTTISAISDETRITVFFQDTSGTIRDVSSQDLTTWTPGKTAISAPPHTDFCAVSHDKSKQIRLYLQDKDDDIVEYYCRDGVWSQTSFRTRAMHGTKMSAVIQRVDQKAISSIYYMNSDGMLCERAQILEGDDLRWLDPVPLGATVPGTEVAGSPAVGEEFTDVDIFIGFQRVKAVKVRSGTKIDGIGLEYHNRTTAPMRGGTGGKMQIFELQEGEYISEVRVHAGDCIEQIQFVTNLGRSSPEYGKPGSGDLNVWKCEGRPLVGFAGTEDRVIHSLRPVWRS